MISPSPSNIHSDIDSIKNLKREYQLVIKGLNDKKMVSLEKNDSVGLNKLDNEISKLSGEYTDNVIALKQGADLTRSEIDKHLNKNPSATPTPSNRLQSNSLELVKKML